MNNKKNIFILAIIVLAFNATSIMAQDDFRNTKWGMDKSSVKSTEKSKIIQEEAIKVIYDSPLSDIKGKLIYTFSASDKLIRGKYYLTPNYLNMNFYVRDYLMFQELLVQKYGNAIITNVVTVNKLKITEAEWAANLMAGNLRVETKWSKDKTDVLLTLSNFGDNPVIQIDYISKEYSDADMKDRKKVISKKL